MKNSIFSFLLRLLSHPCVPLSFVTYSVNQKQVPNQSTVLVSIHPRTVHRAIDKAKRMQEEAATIAAGAGYPANVTPRLSMESMVGICRHRSWPITKIINRDGVSCGRGSGCNGQTVHLTGRRHQPWEPRNPALHTDRSHR